MGYVGVRRIYRHKQQEIQHIWGSLAKLPENETHTVQANNIMILHEKTKQYI